MKWGKKSSTSWLAKITTTCLWNISTCLWMDTIFFKESGERNGCVGMIAVDEFLQLERKVYDTKGCRLFLWSELRSRPFKEILLQPRTTSVLYIISTSIHYTRLQNYLNLGKDRRIIRGVGQLKRQGRPLQFRVRQKWVRQMFRAKLIYRNFSIFTV